MSRDRYESPWKEGLVHLKYLFPKIFADVDWATEPKFLDKELRSIAPDKPKNKSVRELSLLAIQVDSLEEFEKELNMPD